ncbi:hypothetical protein [Pseudogemmobacter faecipullorum]|uniref:DUF1902 domain-containing protein n=1 Tax=Pseudogemmobacter faecipullorum TaxID=2755041 RepID=A0ABS8CQ10_9RHOB|nr:hypothetical protein [Pseudogemmobacter faecipullorum]MCB5411487.1 hypothetical protein [Pseudogemmobacter faecipullorum]
MARYSYVARWEINGEAFYEASEVTDALCDGQKSIVGKVRSQIIDRYPVLKNCDPGAIEVVLGVVRNGREHRLNIR